MGSIVAIVANSLIGEDAEVVIGFSATGMVRDGVGVNHAIYGRGRGCQFGCRG